VGGCRKITAKGDEIKGNRNGKLNYKRNDQMPRTTSQLGQIRYGAEKCKCVYGNGYLHTLPNGFMYI